MAKNRKKRERVSVEMYVSLLNAELQQQPEHQAEMAFVLTKPGTWGPTRTGYEPTTEFTSTPLYQRVTGTVSREYEIEWPELAAAREHGKTFSLATPVDMYFKLLWEHDRLHELVHNNGGARETHYAAINAALTAWHIADWILENVDLNELCKLEVLGAEFPICDEDSFKRWATSFTQLAMCDQIANASKHAVIYRRPKPTWTWTHRLENDVGKVFHIPMVEDGESRMPMTLVIYQAIRFWQICFTLLGVATQAELTSPRSD